MAPQITAEWPEGSDLVEYLTLQGQSGTADEDLAYLCANAVASFVAARTVYKDTSATIPTDLRLSMLMLGAKLYGRRNSPDGVQGANDFGPIRVSRTDPDVEYLLGSWLEIQIVIA